MTNRSQGFALVATLGILAVITLLVFGAAFTSQVERFNTRNDATVAQAEAVARAGLQKYKTVSFQAFNNYLTNLNSYNSVLSRYARCGNLLSVGVDLDRDGIISVEDGDLIDIEKNGRPVTETFNLGATPGEYSIEYHVDGETILLRSTGRVGSAISGAKATVQTVVQGQNGGVFSSALFGGNGSSMKTINGNAEIWGSVYVRGDSTKPDDTVIGSNGSFAMRNHYTEQDLAGKTGLDVSQLGFLNIDVRKQEDMCAHLRVASGKVDFSGSSSVGSSSAPTGYEPKVLGVHVGRGGSDIIKSGSSSFYTRSESPYDLSAPIDFPVLDQAPDGKKFCDRDPSKTWRQCLHEDVAAKGVKITRNANGTTSASPSLNCTTTDANGVTSVIDFSALVTNATLTFGSQSVACVDPTDAPDASGMQRGFKYLYDGTAKKGTLTIDGFLDLQGMDVHMQQDIVVRYKGKASLIVEANGTTGGNVTIDGDVLPAQSFPDQDVLGLLAEKNIRFTGATQNGLLTKQQVAVGLFYAGQQASVEQGAAVLGNITANRFCTSSNCNAGQTAKIFQIPGLEYNLPPGFDNMKNATLATFQILAYERR